MVLSEFAPSSKLKVFYDGLCPVCSKEIDIYRRKDKSSQIDFIDITTSRFDSKAEKLDPDHVMKVFHVKTAQGNIITGVDGFVEIWKTLGIFKPLQNMTQSPITRPLFDWGYVLFTKIRPFLRRKECVTDRCELKH